MQGTVLREDALSNYQGYGCPVFVWILMQADLALFFPVGLFRRQRDHSGFFGGSATITATSDSRIRPATPISATLSAGSGEYRPRGNRSASWPQNSQPFLHIDGWGSFAVHPIAFGTSDGSCRSSTRVPSSHGVSGIVIAESHFREESGWLLRPPPVLARP